MPEAYGSVGVVEKSGEEDDEYDVMIRCLVWKTTLLMISHQGKKGERWYRAEADNFEN